MNTFTATQGSSSSTPNTMLTWLKGRPAPKPAARREAASTGWLDRLAAWSERQPTHHHMGSHILGR